MTPETHEQLRPPTTPENHDIDIDQLNAELAQMTREERISKAYEISGGNLVAATTSGPTSPIMIDSVHESGLDITFVTIIHGHETKETLEAAKWYEDKYELDLRRFYAEFLEIPEEGTLEFLEFQHKIKVEPFEEMLDEIKPGVVLFGVIGYQTEERGSMVFAERRGSIIAINPLLDMTKEEVAEFFEERDLLQNNNHIDPAKGASQKLECGLNTARFETTPESTRLNVIKRILERCLLLGRQA